MLGGWINHRMGPYFPWGTLAVNVVGCFALGFLEGVAPQDEFLLLVVGKGLLAGFTTFSTPMFETLSLARAGSTTGRSSTSSAALPSVFRRCS
jgi:CrcB protein